MVRHERRYEDDEDEHVDIDDEVCLGFDASSFGCFAFLPFPWLKREFKKLVRRIPGEMGCFAFFKLLYIFKALTFDFGSMSSFLESNGNDLSDVCFDDLGV